MTAKGTLRETIRLAYSPVSKVKRGQSRYYLGPAYDRSVVFWMMVFATLYFVG